MSNVGITSNLEYGWLIRWVWILARGSMILGILSSMISVFIGYGLRRFVNRNRKVETDINIISVFFCIVPVWFVYKFLGRFVHFAMAGIVGRAIVCGILGWRLPYRIGKTDKSSLIGRVCLSAGRNILLDFLIVLQGWSTEGIYTFGDMFKIFSSYNLPVAYYALLPRACLVTCIIIVILFCIIGKYFLYPKSKKELLIDML